MQHRCSVKNDTKCFTRSHIHRKRRGKFKNWKDKCLIKCVYILFFPLTPLQWPSYLSVLVVAKSHERIFQRKTQLWEIFPTRQDRYVLVLYTLNERSHTLLTRSHTTMPLKRCECSRYTFSYTVKAWLWFYVPTYEPLHRYTDHQFSVCRQRYLKVIGTFSLSFRYII